MSSSPAAAAAAAAAAWLDTPILDMVRARAAAAQDALKALVRGQTLSPPQSAALGWLLIAIAGIMVLL